MQCMLELSATAVAEIFANRRKASRRSMPTGVELCCNSSIQSATAVAEICFKQKHLMREAHSSKGIIVI